MRAPPEQSIGLPEGLSRDFLLQRGIAPRYIDGSTLIVAATSDAHTDDVDELMLLYRATSFQLHQATRDEVEQAIERLAHASDHPIELDAGDSGNDDGMSDARNLATQPPVVRYVNLIIREALDAGASDVHMDATRTGLSVRFRLDGELSPAAEPPPGLHLAVVSRVKLLAQLDIAERRRPQDGRIRLRLESRELDLRISTVPTLHGESVVLRLLDRGDRPAHLADLGLDDGSLVEMLRVARRPHGMILVTGPTGSGKTTTLYAALGHRDRYAEKIITVEDPIEYQLAGITQVPVHRDTGTTFATALRSILRQDPDVLMIGEMRDEETATLAIQAAMTGHMVFSTLHTNDALGAIPRMLDLGIPPYLVAATVDCVLAQRLVRRVCESCAEQYAPPEEILAALAPNETSRVAPSFVRGTGCGACRNTGFQGRVGLFELVVVDETLRTAINRGASLAVLREHAAEAGMRSLRQDGWHKAVAGITTPEEVLRIATA